MVTQTKAMRCGGCGAVRRGAEYGRAGGVGRQQGYLEDARFRAQVRGQDAAVLRCCCAALWLRRRAMRTELIEAGGRPKMRAKR